MVPLPAPTKAASASTRGAHALLQHARLTLQRRPRFAQRGANGIDLGAHLGGLRTIERDHRVALLHLTADLHLDVDHAAVERRAELGERAIAEIDPRRRGDRRVLCDIGNRLDLDELPRRLRDAHDAVIVRAARVVPVRSGRVRRRIGGGGPGRTGCRRGEREGGAERQAGHSHVPGLRKGWSRQMRKSTQSNQSLSCVTKSRRGAFCPARAFPPR